MKYLFGFIIFCFLLIIVYPCSFFVQAISDFPERFTASSQEIQNPPSTPKTLKEAKTMGERILKNIYGAFKKSWQKVLVAWKKMFSWLKIFWNSYIGPWIQKLWNKILSFLGKEVKKKKPEIKKEFQKEKEEMREDISRVGESLWRRFMELVR